MAVLRGAVAMSEKQYRGVAEAEIAQVEVATEASPATASAVLEIGSRVAAAPSQKAEAKLPQRGSAAAAARFPTGVAAAATMAVAAAEDSKKGKKRAATDSKGHFQSRHKRREFKSKGDEDGGTATEVVDF